MSSSEKNREVWQDVNGWWWYTDENRQDWGPYETEKKATEAMQLHGLEE